MVANDDTLTREQIEDLLRAFEKGDTETAAAFWAEDGVFIDPHYPEPEYRGPDEIRRALDWALENIVEEPGLTVRKVWEDDGTFALEVNTHHLMQDGAEVDFPQVFVIESDAGAIARWRSYLPFPPPPSNQPTG
ncbi:nuclear transport factor 2 family protein [Natrinema sp. 1APR25-10V2]|uniref:nuclear transport factor 2 family protein n=1 Tax=Natrinema sp. 1APR25-10V2 TaxID=2951081 RepID=UPI002874EE5F|nr:nuclear transport factor 2 family protein [Natrinema sp. 1APR25-10V2]MDS0477185.1 nuclear transport factor 2 family protein [Natrinema sp. 1APR25-10V2]